VDKKVTLLRQWPAEPAGSTVDTVRPDDIAERIEIDINKGLLGTGSWLKQIQLEKRYGCSRIDVRQALERLAARRLVRHIPNRGYYVSEFNEQRLRDVAETRVI